MGLETGTYISDLVATNPAGSDDPSQGDDHIRLLKSTVTTTFPGVTGAVTATQAELNLLDGVTATTAELNYVDGVTSEIQTQIDGKEATLTAASQAEMELGTEAVIRSMSPLRVAEAIAELSPGGAIAQQVEATPLTTTVSTTAIIPADNTIPQSGEGVELLTVTITPTSATSRLLIEAHIGMVDGSGVIGAVVAMFEDSDADALCATMNVGGGAGYSDGVYLSHEQIAGTTSAITFKLRAGPSGGTLYINRRSSGATFGGVVATRLRVTEIK